MQANAISIVSIGMMNYPENGPYHISETVEARHFKYGLQIDRDEQKQVISERA